MTGIGKRMSALAALALLALLACAAVSPALAQGISSQGSASGGMRVELSLDEEEISAASFKPYALLTVRADNSQGDQDALLSFETASVPDWFAEEIEAKCPPVTVKKGDVFEKTYTIDTGYIEFAPVVFPGANREQIHIGIQASPGTIPKGLRFLVELNRDGCIETWLDGSIPRGMYARLLIQMPKDVQAGRAQLKVLKPGREWAYEIGMIEVDGIPYWTVTTDWLELGEVWTLPNLLQADIPQTGDGWGAAQYALAAAVCAGVMLLLMRGRRAAKTMLSLALVAALGAGMTAYAAISKTASAQNAAEVAAELTIPFKDFAAFGFSETTGTLRAVAAPAESANP